MKVSVIVPTFNGAKKIINTLQSLENQHFKDFEVVVVIDGSTDNTTDLLRSTQFNFQECRIIEQENRGRAGCRNRGGAEANGDLLIFIDDDIRAIAKCIALHFQHHQQYQNSIAVGSVPEDLKKVQTDFQAYKAFLSRKWTEPLQENNGLISVEKPFLTAANFSVSKTLFQKLGGFDNKLSDAEDFDLAVRASLQSVPIYFLQEAIGWHDDFVTCRSYILRLRQYRKSHEMLQSLKPNLYEKYNFYNFRQIGFFRKTIYNLLSQNIWIKLIDKSNIFRILPRPLRYRLYDLITTGLSVYFPDRKI